MPRVLWIHWIIFLIPRIILWPVLWFDIRMRRTGKRPDEWHPIDQWLVSHGHVVRTWGYFFWERPKGICWWCLFLWTVPLIFWLGTVTPPSITQYFKIG